MHLEFSGLQKNLVIIMAWVLLQILVQGICMHHRLAFPVIFIYIFGVHHPCENKHECAIGFVRIALEMN